MNQKVSQHLSELEEFTHNFCSLDQKNDSGLMEIDEEKSSQMASEDARSMTSKSYLALKQSRSHPAQEERIKL